MPHIIRGCEDVGQLRTIFCKGIWVCGLHVLEVAVSEINVSIFGDGYAQKLFYIF